MQYKNRMNSVIKLVLVLLAVAIALGILYRIGSQALIAFDKMNRQIQMVEYGTMEERLAAQAAVLNHEEIFLAREAGRFENMAKDKEKVGKGTLLGYFITNEGKSIVRAAEAGVFVRTTDGLEEVFANLDLAGVTSEVFQYKPTPTFLEKPVQIGQPIYKIVDGLMPTRLLLKMSADASEIEIQPGQKLAIVGEGEDWGRGWVVELQKESGDLMMMVQLDSFCEKSINKRFIKVDAVLDSRTGFLVPAQAIVARDGKQGVYCAVGKFTEFKPVEIIKQKDDIVLVDGLDKNDFIVTNPTARI